MSWFNEDFTTNIQMHIQINKIQFQIQTHIHTQIHIHIHIQIPAHTSYLSFFLHYTNNSVKVLTQCQITHPL